MKIIKRNGSEVPFDITKIITAVTKASDSVGGKSRLTREQINQIADDVTEQCQALNRAVSVEEIQDMVENKLMDMKAHDIARHYITYRYIQSLKRQTNTTDERILSLIECQNEEVKQENANKNPTVNSVQRDYMAGEISKDLTARLLLDQLADLFVERHAFDQFRGAPPVLRGDGLRPGGIQHEGRQYGKDAIFHR